MAGDHAPDHGEGHAEGSELSEMDARGRDLETLLVARGRDVPSASTRRPSAVRRTARPSPWRDGAPGSARRRDEWKTTQTANPNATPCHRVIRG